MSKVYPMLKEISIVCLSVLMIVGCSREEPPSEIVYARPLNPYHVVKAGETTLIVAQKYGMNEDELIKINRLKSPYKLIPGQRLLVHAKADAQSPSTTPAKEGDVIVKPLASATDATVSAVGAVAGAAAVVSMPTPGKGSSLTTDAPTVTDAVPSNPPVASAGYEWPVQGEVIQNFGQQPDGTTNDGINIRAPANVPVKAIAEGTIKDAGARIPAYGNMLVLKHLDGKLSVYAHLSEITVKQGDKIAKGQVIGRVGDTGSVKNNHQLYLQIRDAKLKPIDPIKLLS